ncbi:MAG TPA: trehalose-6-phosphate synthase, partial [Bacteroidales bacterium]|nr:trehalose-6-phosphate synthase [Bacteroidales bacterium]
MKKLFIASRQVPVNIIFSDEGMKVEHDDGISLPGLQDFYEQFDTTWVGHTGVESYKCNEKEKAKLERELKKCKCVTVNSDPEDYTYFVHHFSRNTIWPLFHYFPQHTSYDDRAWEAYKRVNSLYAD